MKKIKELTNKVLTKDIILYIVFGILSTIINFSIFYIMANVLHWDENFSNIIAIVAAVLFAYATNKNMVFHSNAKTLNEKTKQFIKFMAGRAFTMVIEFLGGYILFKLPIPNVISKGVVTILVIILNFFLSKYFAFRTTSNTNKIIYLINNNKKMIIFFGIYSFFMAIAIVLERKIVFTGEVGDTYTKNVFLPFEAIDLLKFAIAFLSVYIITIIIGLILQNKKITILSKSQKEYGFKSNIKFWTIFTCITAICWLPFFLTYAPGAVLGDSTASIAQGLNYSLLNNHHPVLYSIYVGVFMRIGRLFNNYNLGVALYSFTQLLIMAGVIGYTMLWLRKKNVSLIYIVLSWLYFSTNIIFAKYAIIMWKDPLFCSFLLLMILLLFDIVNSNGKIINNKSVIFKFVILTVLISFFRNNGFLITAITYVVLLLVYRKKALIFDIILGITLVIILIIQGPIYKKFNINSPFEEAVAIPLQQIARTVAYDGKITEEQKEFLEKLYPEESFKTTYQPMIVDSVKWNEKFNKNFLYDNKVEFFKVWAEMLVPNFNDYVKAYLMNTFGFWSTYMQNWYGLADTYIIWEKLGTENDYNIHRVDLIEKVFGFSIEDYFNEPKYIGSGTLFWIMLLVIVILIINGKSKYIIALLPGILTWVTIMISTPVAFSLRYVFILAYALPIIIALPFITKKNIVM